MEMKKTSLKGNIIKINFGNEIDAETNNLSGTIELDIENQMQFIDSINSTLDEGNSLVLIEMDNISYIDSSGLWALFESHKKAEQRNGKLILVRPTPDVKRVLDITKMSSKIHVFDSEEKAIISLESTPETPTTTPVPETNSEPSPTPTTTPAPETNSEPSPTPTE